MAVVSFVNQKGGTAKTTSAVNVAGWLALKGNKVLLIDLDPQAHATSHMIDPSLVNERPHIGDILFGNKGFEETVCQASYHPNFYFVPSHIRLSFLEYRQGGTVGSGMAIFNLREKMEQIRSNYDYIICDCPPNIGFFTISTLIACDYIVVPLEPEPMAFDGLTMLMGSIIPDIISKVNKTLKVGGILLTKVDERRKLTQKIRDEVLKSYHGLKFDQEIHVDVKLAEAAEAHKPVCFFAPTSKGSQEYEAVTDQLISRISPR